MSSSGVTVAAAKTEVLELLENVVIFSDDLYEYDSCQDINNIRRF